MEREWDKNKAAKLIDDYDIGGNHGLGEVKRVRNTDNAYKLGRLPRKLKRKAGIRLTKY